MSRLALPLLSLLLLSCVPEVAQTVGCVTDDDCAAGEACVQGACGGDPITLPPAPDGGIDTRVSCTLADEVQRCGPGAYCAADGYCDSLPDCTGGCPTGLECNDASGSCFRTPECEDCCTPGSCSDGRWCNGLEECDTVAGRCVSADPPCGAQACDETNRACLCTTNNDCTAPNTCQDGTCACEPACTGRQCGSDGCGGTCGTCANEDTCDNTSGRCVCAPSCDGVECGSDGCDGTCGTCTGNDVCQGGVCECQPSCSGKVCGDDGCGGSCGTCASGTCAPNGQCNCTADCSGRVCGDDGCGGSCGTCTSGSCGVDGQCDCVASCTNRECGSDGCGGSCGACGLHQLCSGTQQCVNDGVVCDVLTDVITMDEYQSRSGFLTDGFDEEYEWDGRPYRIIDNYPYVGPTGITVDVELTSDEFDPVLYVYENSGACIRVAKDDDSGPGLGSALSVTLAPGGQYHFVVTSFGERDTGQYSLKTSTTLCGLIAAPDVYEKCAPRVQANSCNGNWCVDYGTSTEFCCIKPTCPASYGQPSNTATIQTSPTSCGT